MNTTIRSLCRSYSNYFPIGAAVSPDVIETHNRLLVQHFNSLTPENHMKFGLIHPEKDKYVFDNADKIVTFALENKMKVRGHTFVWHNQNPGWLFKNGEGTPASREILLKRLEAHIKTVMEHYRGKVYCWDVVNEALEDKGDDLLRRTQWLEIIGEDYIEKAFRYAHDADPQALLFYNDYSEAVPQKRDKIYRLIKELKQKDVPIHGLGLQSHWNISDPSMEHLREAIGKYASLGVKLQITEMDISMYGHSKMTALTVPTEEMLEKQADKYEQAFRLFREYKDIITGITFWGAADDRTWLDNFPIKGRKNWPLLFDVNKNPKKALYKVVNFSEEQ